MASGTTARKRQSSDGKWYNRKEAAEWVNARKGTNYKEWRTEYANIEALKRPKKKKY